MSGPPQFVREKLAEKGKAIPDPPDKGGSGGRFPIANGSDLDKAIKAVGRVNGDAEKTRVRKHIIAQAKKLGLSSRIPAGWAADGSAKTTD